MTTNSIDLFLEEVHVLVIFLKDGFISLQVIDSEGKVYESGDILHLARQEAQLPETCIVLGMSEIREEAVRLGQEYFRRVCKWHGCEEDAPQLTMNIFTPGIGELFTQGMDTEEVDVCN
ncbi:Nonribosomal peptide synthetase 30 [Frankliniella fusca]|uniref:Nonribosomal peptide synthetase 30 n=1 Tax=Frankliniella fusca TaxID=407009 RepID=A0AAE1LGH5_9NEOP|nr:Nonribosomal peptide synthetase 30 [Frankliniella fusca]KAK3920019.1 Nonribosomal peptide synthetase 30 [Frankliniella fusca]